MERDARDMCEVRHVNYDRITLGSRELWWYPYSPKSKSLLRRLFQFVYGEGLGRFKAPGKT